MEKHSKADTIKTFLLYFSLAASVAITGVGIQKARKFFHDASKDFEYEENSLKEKSTPIQTVHISKVTGLY